MQSYRDDFQEKNLERWVGELPVKHSLEPGLQTWFRQSLPATGLPLPAEPQHHWLLGGHCDGDLLLHCEIFNSIPGIHPPEAPYMPHLWDNPNISSRHGLGMQKQLLLRITVLKIRFLKGKVEPMRVESSWWLKVKCCFVTIRCYYLQTYLFVHTLNLGIFMGNRFVRSQLTEKD